MTLVQNGFEYKISLTLLSYGNKLFKLAMNTNRYDKEPMLESWSDSEPFSLRELYSGSYQSNTSDEDDTNIQSSENINCWESIHSWGSIHSRESIHSWESIYVVFLVVTSEHWNIIWGCVKWILWVCMSKQEMCGLDWGDAVVLRLNLFWADNLAHKSDWKCAHNLFIINLLT